jgi:hypothetical protein
MANVERLKELRETVLRNPEKWDQSNWAAIKGDVSCGTTLCLAGWACTLAGREPLWRAYEGDSIEQQLNNWGIVTTGLLVPTEEELESNPDVRVWIANFAETWLDLTPEQANDLFYSGGDDHALGILDELIANAKAGLA